MKINQSYNFFFHPFSKQHSLFIKTLSVITIVALSAITAGVYFIVFLTINLKDNWIITKKAPVNNSSLLPVSGFVGIENLKKKQAEHLSKLQTLAAQGLWEHLREHTWHPDSGFDWWMFPINRPSASQGAKYQVRQEDIVLLKTDLEFMNSYREGFKLILLSWGWDASCNLSIQNDKQRWTNYQVRLGKMLHSLTLFDEKELLQKVKNFCNTTMITPNLEPWIRQYLVAVE